MLVATFFHNILDLTPVGIHYTIEKIEIASVGRGLPKPNGPLIGLAGNIQSNLQYYIWGRLSCKSCRKYISVNN